MTSLAAAMMISVDVVMTSVAGVTQLHAARSHDNACACRGRSVGKTSCCTDHTEEKFNCQ